MFTHKTLAASALVAACFLNACGGSGDTADSSDTTATAGGNAAAPAPPAAPRTDTVVAPAAPPAPAALVLAAGTSISANVTDTITSRAHRAGNPISAIVSTGVRDRSGRVVIPANAVLRGTIQTIAPAERPGQPGTLTLQYTTVRFNNATYPISAQVTSMDTVMIGRGVTTAAAATVGAGAAAGAVAGRVIEGSRTGTIVGGAVGAAAGTAVAAATRDIDVVFPRNNEVRLSLTAPFRPQTTARATP